MRFIFEENTINKINKTKLLFSYFQHKQKN